MLETLGYAVFTCSEIFPWKHPEYSVNLCCVGKGSGSMRVVVRVGRRL